MNARIKQPLVQERNSALPQSIRIPPPAGSNPDGFGLGIQGRTITEKGVSPHSARAEMGFKVCYGFELAAWAIAGLSAFAFTIVLLTPILVPILSLGSVFTDGWREWLDFAITALKMSVNPALVGLTCGALAMGLRKGKAALEGRLTAEDDKNDDFRRLEKLIPPKIAH